MKTKTKEKIYKYAIIFGYIATFFLDFMGISGLMQAFYPKFNAGLALFTSFILAYFLANWMWGMSVIVQTKKEKRKICTIKG